MVKDPLCILVKTISWAWSNREARPIVIVTHKTGKAGETLFCKSFLFTHLKPQSLIQACNLSLECLMISCGHGSKLPLCVDGEIVITALQPQLWCADRWQPNLFRHLWVVRVKKLINLRWKGQFKRIFLLSDIQVFVLVSAPLHVKCSFQQQIRYTV